jgi:thiol-disulfide isomerase/thioredoxin
MTEDHAYNEENDNAIITSKYALHLKHYALNIGIWQDSTTLNHLKNKNYSDAYKRSLNTIIGNVEKGLSRDLMCYKSLSSLLDLSYIDYDIVSQKIDTYIENNILKEVLREKENDYKNKKKLNITLLDPKTNEEKKITGDFWAELKEKFKGKVVYIDIWTTWCAPCRLEIPHAIRLHNYFKVKNIAFVNLCLESNKNEWQKMIKSKNIKGYNYFLNQAQSQMLRAKLEFDGYPTYLIIDKKGNLVNKNAPRPSSNEDIKDVLNKWIEEKNP